MTRQNGFYWVTFHSFEAGVLGLDKVESRVVAEYLNGSWFVTGSQFEVYEENDISDVSTQAILDRG